MLLPDLQLLEISVRHKVLLRAFILVPILSMLCGNILTVIFGLTKVFTLLSFISLAYRKILVLD